VSESPVPTDEDADAWAVANGRAADATPSRPEDSTLGRQRDRGRLVGVLLGYSALRFGLTALLTLGLMFLVPLIIAMAIAVIVQLPLSMLLFARQGDAARAALAELRAERRAERAELRGALYGGERTEGDAAR
jgi:Protein of unknown function (DUF4229)